MAYDIPKNYFCKKGHIFQYSQSWEHWYTPVDSDGNALCPECYINFLKEHVSIGTRGEE